MGLLPLLLGSLYWPEAAFLRRVRVRQAATASNSTGGRPTVHRRSTQAPSVRQLQTGRPDDRTEPESREGVLCCRELVDAPSTRVCLAFCHAAFSFTSSQGRHRHRSVCGDTEAVVAARRRICAALRQEARIAINSAHGSSTTKAIIAAPPLSGRTGDGASRRDSRKSLPVVRYRNASWL